jgi:ligand-binding sensor domain-containing protein
MPVSHELITVLICPITVLAKFARVYELTLGVMFSAVVDIYRVKNLLLIWCFLLVGESLIAQEPAKQQFTVRDGLQSNAIYSLFQDSRGFLWVGTDKGVMRYNGEAFEEIMHQRKYPLLEVYRIIEDDQGVIWLSTRECRLYKYESQTVEPYEHNHVLDSIRLGRSIYVTDFTVATEENVHVSINGRPSYVIGSEGRADSSQTQVLSFEKIIGDQWLLTMPRLSPCKMRGDHWVERIDSGIRKELVFHMPETAASCDIRTIRDAEDPIFSIGRMIYKVLPDTCLSYQAKGSVASFDCDQNGNIWFGLVNGGVQCLNPHLEIVDVELDFLKNVTVSSLAFDSFDQMWIGTSSRGLFRIKNSKILHYTTPGESQNNEVVDVAIQDSMVHVAYSGGYFLAHDLKEDSVHHFDYTDEHKGVVVRSMVYDTAFDRLMYLTVGGSDIFQIDSKGHWKEMLVEHPYVGRKMAVVGGRVLCFAGGGVHRLIEIVGEELVGVISIEKENLTQSGFDGFLIHDVKLLSNGNYLLGTGAGLYTFDGHEFYRSGEDFGLESTRAVEHILPLDEGCLFANSEDGVFGQFRGRSIHISSEDGLISDYILSLVADGEFLHIGTNDGLHSIRMDNLHLQNPPIVYSHFGEKIRVLKCGLGCLWTGTSSGLTRTPLEEYHRRQSPPEIELVSCDIGERHTMSVEDGVMILPNSVENLDFNFAVVDISHHGSIHFEYVVPEIGDHWKTSSTGLLQFAGIGFGDYTLQVRAQRTGGPYSKMLSIPFKVKTPVFLRWWFIALVVVLLLIVIVVFLQLARLGERRKLARKNKMAMLTQQALSARMDPHFIFNSLNSLKYFIKIQDLDSASKYLNDFARLMRSNIEYVKDDMIELKQEIELLRNYCSLENMRLENCADFKILVDPDVDPKLRIPSMILQPIVENAIWHGLGSKIGEKKLSISVKMDRSDVVFRVEDNGIGREAAAKLSPPRQRKESKHSLEFITERLKLFTQIHSKSFGLAFEDRQDWYGQSIGTKCELRFPKIKGSNSAAVETLSTAG